MKLSSTLAALPLLLLSFPLFARTHVNIGGFIPVPVNNTAFYYDSLTAMQVGAKISVFGYNAHGILKLKGFRCMLSTQWSNGNDWLNPYEYDVSNIMMRQGVFAPGAQQMYYTELAGGYSFKLGDAKAGLVAGIGNEFATGAYRYFAQGDFLSEGRYISIGISLRQTYAYTTSLRDYSRSLTGITEPSIKGGFRIGRLMPVIQFGYSLYFTEIQSEACPNMMLGLEATL